MWGFWALTDYFVATPTQTRPNGAVIMPLIAADDVRGREDEGEGGAKK